MPKPKKPVERMFPSRFILRRQHRKLLAEKRSKDTRVSELTKLRDDAREKAIVSGKGWDKEQRALGIAESGLVSINRTIMTIEKELDYPQS